mmetsp:Transcript_4431/g.6520  ORF Transcript_4431/g.6520 Transcript_4431/m.6520 type:complete len:356 (-) Transcript_4431:462-1529(-)
MKRRRVQALACYYLHVDQLLQVLLALQSYSYRISRRRKNLGIVPSRLREIVVVSGRQSLDHPPRLVQRESYLRAVLLDALGEFNVYVVYRRQVRRILCLRLRCYFLFVLRGCDDKGFLLLLELVNLVLEFNLLAAKFDLLLRDLLLLSVVLQIVLLHVFGQRKSLDIALVRDSDDLVRTTHPVVVEEQLGNRPFGVELRRVYDLSALVLAHLQLPGLEPNDKQALTISVHISVYSADGSDDIFVAGLPEFALALINSVGSVGKGVAEAVIVDGRQLGNLRLLFDFVDELLALEHSDLEIIASRNQLWDPILVEIEEGDRSYIVATHSPEPLFSIDVEPCDGAIATRDDDGLLDIW